MNLYLRWLEEMGKLKGLGKGLDALLAESQVDHMAVVGASDESLHLHKISLDKIIPGSLQPRILFDEDSLKELAQSIAINGVVQPIVVRKKGSSYEIIAGERRYRASKLAKLTDIPAIVRDFNDEEALVISLIENIQRKDLNVIEEALGYKRLVDEYGLTHEQLAKVSSRSRSHISNILRLLNLHDEVKQMIMSRKLDMGHARALLPLNATMQLALAQTIIKDGLSTGEVERRVAKLLHQQNNNTSSDTSSDTRLDADIVKLERDIADKIGMMVNIKHGRRGNGKIILTYSSLDELDNLLKLL